MRSTVARERAIASVNIKQMTLDLGLYDWEFGLRNIANFKVKHWIQNCQGYDALSTSKHKPRVNWDDASKTSVLVHTWLMLVLALYVSTSFNLLMT